MLQRYSPSSPSIVQNLPYRGEKLYSLMAEEILDILNTINLSESFGEDALLSAQYVLQCAQPA